jgi:hypothetical protein
MKPRFLPPRRGQDSAAGPHRASRVADGLGHRIELRSSNGTSPANAAEESCHDDGSDQERLDQFIADLERELEVMIRREFRRLERISFWSEFLINLSFFLLGIVITKVFGF